jgi:membrane protease YdiL (CAAX protease family)
MATQPTIPAHDAPDPTRSGNIADLLTAIIEVLIAFLLVHLSYRSLKHFTDLGRLEGAAGLNFSPGVVMILFTVAVLLLCRRSFEEYGLTLNGWRYSLNVGLLWSVLFVAVAGLVIKFASIHFDPLHPPDMKKAIVATFGELINTLLLLLFLMRERRVLQQIHPFWVLLILIGLLAVPLVVALSFNRPFLNVLLTDLWLFFGAGFGEEIFFRGYLHSRVNQAFGRPFRFLGVDFGLGLIASSVLFGFIHALNTVDYFGGPFDFAWLWWLPNFAGGLFFGFLREKRRSILPGAIIHGLSDVFASVPGLFP